MARVTHVARAQQQYETVPVLDADGQPVYTVTDRKTKTGRTVRIAKTREDRTRPKPARVCDHCRKPIEVGTPYKWVKPKTGPYGGAKRNRHESCPSWRTWELSDSLSARLDQVEDEFQHALNDATEEGEFKAAVESFAEGVRQLAEEKAEAAQNIVDGFGHETSQSEEIQSVADELESWADELEGWEEPELPEPEAEDCPECSGRGKVDCDNCDGFADEECQTCDGQGEVDCDECDGTGEITPEEPTQEQLDEWAESARNEAEELASSRPV